MIVIRTQDKKELLQFDENKINVRIKEGNFIKHNKESFEVYSYQLEASEQDVEHCWKILGRYGSVERAISMLDKIQWFLSELRLFNACCKLNMVLEERNADFDRLNKVIFEVCEME